MTTRRELLALAALSTPLSRSFAQAGPIRIGEINSYSTIPQFTIPYRMGWQLAVEEANAAGGVLGRRIEVVSRDDAGKPEDAIRLATELVSNERVALLAGTFLSNVGLAVAAFALRSKVLFVAAEPLTDACSHRNRDADQHVDAHGHGNGDADSSSSLRRRSEVTGEVIAILVPEARLAVTGVVMGMLPDASLLPKM